MSTDSITIAPLSEPMRGIYSVPGDKSISHRALFFGTLCPNLTVRGLAPGDDVECTRNLIESAGYVVRQREEGISVTRGDLPTDPLATAVRIECGNSGTTARLGLGWLTGERGLWKVTGDESLKGRPMARIIDPLTRLGAHFRGGPDRLPVSVIADRVLSGSEDDPGGDAPIVEVTSAQVHAGLLLAGLRSTSALRLRRTLPMRDHTLRLSSLLGLPITTEGDVDLVTPISNVTPIECSPHAITIPGDFSSAAFLIAAALLRSDSDVTIENVGLNPTRTAFLEGVRSMGADLEVTLLEDAWEPVGTIRVRGGRRLVGAEFSEETIDMHGMADEIPLLALLAATADGPSVIADAAELRVKESDRIVSTVRILRSLGLEIEETRDGFRSPGGGVIRGGVAIDPDGDHRLAMLAAVAGLSATDPVTVNNAEVVSVSWPDFWTNLSSLRQT